MIYFHVLPNPNLGQNARSMHADQQPISVRKCVPILGPILHATNAVRSAQSGVFGEEASSTLDIGEKKFEQKGWERERNDAWDRD